MALELVGGWWATIWSGEPDPSHELGLDKLLFPFRPINIRFFVCEVLLSDETFSSTTAKNRTLVSIQKRRFLLHLTNFSHNGRSLVVIKSVVWYSVRDFDAPKSLKDSNGSCQVFPDSSQNSGQYTSTCLRISKRTLPDALPGMG